MAWQGNRLMTLLLDKAFSEATKLPEERQNHLAQIILDVMADDEHWDGLFADSQDILANMANEAIAEYNVGEKKTCSLETR